ncbi:MAG: hypothetical protein HYZ53_06930 [Planctomycetes bacterium]|nr:hypothetical protein [Planctomycetota bacterium]
MRGGAGSPAEAAPAHARVTGSTSEAAARALFLLLLSVFLLTASPRADTLDGIVRFAVAQSLAERGAFDIPFLEIPDMPLTSTGPDGKHYAYWGLGQSLLYLPGVLLAGRDWGYRLANLVSPVLMAAALAFLARALLALGVGCRRSVAVALVAAFTTPMWVYSRSWFEVSIEAFCFNGVLLGLVRWNAATSAGVARRSLAFAAALLAFAVVTRPVSVLLLPAVAAFVVAARWWIDPASSRAARVGWAELARDALVAVPFAVAGAATMLAYNHLRTGSAFSFYLASHVQFVYAGDRRLGLAGLLVSPWKSIFVYAPAILLALDGWPALWRRSPAVTVAVAVAAVCYFGFYSGVVFWSGDRAWGPRYVAWLCPWLCLPLAFARFPWNGRAGRAVTALVLSFAAVVEFAGVSAWCIRYQNILERVEGRPPLYAAVSTNYDLYYRVLDGPIPAHLTRLVPTWRDAFRFVPEPAPPGLMAQWDDPGHPRMDPRDAERCMLGYDLFNVPFVWWVAALRHGVPAESVCAGLTALLAGAAWAGLRLRALAAAG